MFLFLHETQFSGYADDNTPLVAKHNMPDAISALEKIGEQFLIWFSDNQIKLSTDKCHLLNTDKCHLLMNTQDQNFMKIGKLLGITFDGKL